MKKFAIALVVMISLFATTNCFAQEKDYIIFKNDDGKVTVTTVSHFGNDGKKVVIQTSELTNPTLSELSVLGIPEDAWKMVSSPNAGVYDSRLIEQEKVSQRQDEENTRLQKDFEDANEGKEIFKLLFGVAAVIIVVLAFVIAQLMYGVRKLKTEKATQKN